MLRMAGVVTGPSMYLMILSFFGNMHVKILKLLRLKLENKTESKMISPMRLNAEFLKFITVIFYSPLA